MTAYNTPTDVSTNDLVTAAYMNTYWQNNIKHLHEAVNSVVVLEDQKTQNTNGGTATSGSWQTRTLNTEVTDVNNICALSSNQFTLDAGTYEIIWRAPVAQVGEHQTRLQNVTDGTTVLTGSAMRTPTADLQSQDSCGFGRFTVAASKALEIQHRVKTTASNTGYGLPSNFTTEVYTQVWLRKVA